MPHVLLGIYQCCACKWFGTSTPCKCKNKYIDIVLRGPIKQCKYMTMCDFYLKRGDFIMFLKISLGKWPIAKKKKKIIKMYTHN